MLGMFRAMMPKEAGFFDMFERHAETLVGGAEVMSRMFAREEGIEEACRRISEFEHQADDVTREVLHAVRRTFITPFDRSDIKDLIGSMDDAIDQMHKTAKAITLFEQRQFQPDMVTLGDVIVKTADLTAEAVPLLRSLRANAHRLTSLTEQVTRLEGDSDDLYDRGMAALFRGPARSDPMAYIVGAEIYDHLEKVVDRFEDVADRINGVLIEHL